MAAVDAAWIAAGASVTGDLLSAAGQGGANEKNVQIAEMQDQFNSAEAAANRNFQATQARQNLGFQAEEATLNRNFQAFESNTQMQRRVTDLIRAGLNPALAYQLGGASAMPGSMPGGAQAGGSQAMASGNPNMQNPAAAFGQLGAQAASALALNTQQANIDLMKANASKANAEAGSEIPAQVENIKSATALNDTRAAEVYKNIQLLSLQLAPADTPDASMYTAGLKADLASKTARASIMQMDAQTQSDTLLSLIKARNDENYAVSIGARNIYNASDGAFGKLMAYFRLGSPMVGTAQGVANTAGALSDALIP